MDQEDRKIIANLIKTPDGTILQSHYRHDYVVYIDKNGSEYMVDGGLDYLRRNIPRGPDYEELSVFEGDPHQLIRKHMRWGTRGKTGKDPLKWVSLAEMSDDHINACLKTQAQMAERFRRAMEVELKYRLSIEEEKKINKEVKSKKRSKKSKI